MRLAVCRMRSGRTADLAKPQPDGSFAHLGRSDGTQDRRATRFPSGDGAVALRAAGCRRRCPRFRSGYRLATSAVARCRRCARSTLPRLREAMTARFGASALPRRNLSAPRLAATRGQWEAPAQAGLAALRNQRRGEAHSLGPRMGRGDPKQRRWPSLTACPRSHSTYVWCFRRPLSGATRFGGGLSAQRPRTSAYPRRASRARRGSSRAQAQVPGSHCPRRPTRARAPLERKRSERRFRPVTR